MVSKNNRIERMEETAERQSHFGIRKLTIGAASVLLGTTLFFGTNAKVAKAEVADNTDTDGGTTPVQDDHATENTTTESVQSTEDSNSTADITVDAGSTEKAEQSVENSDSVKIQTPKTEAGADAQVQITPKSGNESSSLETNASDAKVYITVRSETSTSTSSSVSAKTTVNANQIGKQTENVAGKTQQNETKPTITEAADKFSKQGVKQAAKQTVKTDQQAATTTSESNKQQDIDVVSNLDITDDSNIVGVIGKKDINTENKLNVKSPAATILVAKDIKVTKQQDNKDDAVTPAKDKGGTIISDENATTVDEARKAWQDAYNKINAAVKVSQDRNELPGFTISKNNAEPIIEPAGTDAKTTIKDLQDQAKKMAEQADQIDKLVEQQKSDLVKWRKDNNSREDQFKDDLKNWRDKFTKKLEDTYGWTEDQINAFFGDELKHTSLIDANTCIDGAATTLDDTGLTKVPLNKDTWGTLPSWVKTVEETKGHLYELHVGSTFKYKNVFTDSNTNKNVDIKFIVTDLSGEKSGIFALDPNNLIWDRAAPSVKIPVTGLRAEFLESDKKVDTPIEINPIIGVGDIDCYQSLIIKNDQIRGDTDKAKNNNILFGENVAKNTIQEIKDKKLNPYLIKDHNFSKDDIVLRNSDGKVGVPVDPGFQAWIRLKNTTSFDFSFGAGTFLKNGTDEYEWALGNIGLPGLKPTMPPTKTADYSYENVITKVDKDHPGDYKTTDTATRTINYQDEDGKTVKDNNGKNINPVTQTVNFYGEGYEDLGTGKLVNLDKDHHIILDKDGKAVPGTLTWVGPDGKTDVGSWSDKPSPVVDGYHITNVDKDSKNGVDVDPVNGFNHTKDDYTVTVTY